MSSSFSEKRKLNNEDELLPNMDLNVRYGNKFEKLNKSNPDLPKRHMHNLSYIEKKNIILLKEDKHSAKKILSCESKPTLRKIAVTNPTYNVYNISGLNEGKIIVINSTLLL